MRRGFLIRYQPQDRRWAEHVYRSLQNQGIRCLLSGDEVPKTASQPKTPIIAAALAGMLFIAFWAVHASSANLKQYREAFAEQEAAARRAVARHIQAQEAREAAQRFSSQDRWREAEQALSRAIEIDPLYAQAYFERGRVHFRQHRYEAAIQDFNSAIRLDPDLASGATTLRILAQQAETNNNFRE
jgi:tetratricopeptide (TPR) repeat protein